MTLPTLRNAPLTSLFEVTAGSVAGASHLAAGRGNQDAFAWDARASALVAVACDGCGSGARSEVGAALAARLIVEETHSLLARGPSPLSAGFFESVGSRVLGHLRALARAMGGGLESTVHDYLLFTVVGAVVREDVTVAFALGDGLVVVNERAWRLGPFEGNAPPYLSRSLVGSDPRDAALRVVTAIETRELDTLVLGTDGAVDFLEASSADLREAASADLREAARMASDDRLYRNPDALRRRLAVAARGRTRMDWEQRRVVREAAPLADDATLVLVRRRPDVEPAS